MAAPGELGNGLMAHFLITAKADPEMKDRKGKTALDLDTSGTGAISEVLSALVK